MDTQTSDKVVNSQSDPTLGGPRADLQSLGKRVRACRGEMSQDQFAGELGLHPNTVSKFERGIVEPGALIALKIATLGGRGVEWLIAGEGGAPTLADGAAMVERQVRAIEVGNYVYVPHFDVRLSGGHGAFNDVTQVIAMRPFSTDFIRRDLNISHNEIVLTDVSGSSMEPQLSSRDTTMLDLRDNEVLSEGVHAIRMDDTLLVKNLQRLPGRVLRVSSFSDSFAPFDVQGEEADGHFGVVGRVCWAGVKFK